MRKPTRTELTSRRRARTGMAVFLVALINMTLQPCAMAAQALISPDLTAVSEHCLEHGHQVSQQEYQSVDNCVLDADFLADGRSLQGDNKKSEDAPQPFVFVGYAIPGGTLFSIPVLEYSNSKASFAGEPSIPDLFCRYLK